MLNLDSLMRLLDRFTKIIRSRYGEVIIDKISVYKSKYIIYMTILNSRVKIIIDKRKPSVRVYCGLVGLEKSIRRVLTREYLKILKEKSYGEESL